MTLMDDRGIDVASPTLAAGNARPSLAAGASDLTERIIAALRTVHDPEIPVNIYDLGLIYRIEPKQQGLVEIDMTLTAPGCPVAGEMLKWVETAVSGVENVGSVDVNLVFDPPWDKSRMSEDVQLELGLI
jgi:FeS assembly SUF system protein